MKRPWFLVVTMVAALVVAGCGSGGGDGSGGDGKAGSAGAPTSPATPTETPATDDGTGGGGGAPEPSAGTDSATPGGGGDWTSGPLTVTHDVAVPPVPQLVGIRSAAHPDVGYDRIVFDFTGPLPGYAVRYVDEVREDPSDLPVTMPGRRYLLITFTPAQAHTDAGEALISPKSAALDYPMLRGYVLVGDFEGYVSVALGLDDVVGYRLGELPGQPGRVYLDVAA
jgi:hypothetical protein